MSNVNLAPESDAVALQGVSRLAEIKGELDEIRAALSAAPMWKPSAGLLAEADWCQDKIEQLRASWGHKLTVAIVGPSGAGKSTLLNALAGKQLSASGIERPTTRQVIVYTRIMADAEDLVQHCGADRVQVVSDYHASGLEHLVLVDSPDTNTLPENQEMLKCVLERADLLITLFPATNPKMQDNVTFLRPYIAMLPANAVVPVLNWVDRVPLGELQEVIVPDFKRWIAQEWHTTSPVFLISAKRSAPGSQFFVDEQPLHDINEYDALREYLALALNQTNQVSDRRLARAEHIISLLKRDCRNALDDKAQARLVARENLREIGRHATRALTEMPMRAGLTPELNSTLYADLCQRWWGPVGWLLVLWSLLVRLSTFIGHLIRRGRLTLPLRGDKTEQESLILAAAEVSTWNTRLDQIKAEKWPLTVDALAAAGFTNAIRKPASWDDWVLARSHQLTELWGLAYRERLDRTAERLSFWGLQILFNAPILVMVGWLGYQTIAGFINQRYLSLDYFRHSGITLAIVWLASFILLQMIIAVAVRGALRRSLHQVIAEESATAAPLLKQFAALDALDRAC